MASPTANMLKKQSANAEAVTEGQETVVPAVEQAAETPAEAAKKPVAKKPAAKKPVEKASTPTDSILATQPVDGDLTSLVGTIETVTKSQAYTLARELVHSAEFNYFKLGGILSVIQDKGWWQESGYQDFRSFVEAEVGIYYRKAMYLIQIYRDIADSGVEWAEVAAVGWTKLKEISPYLAPDNVQEWVERAKNMTVVQLSDYIKSLKGGSDHKASEQASSAVTTMTFKLHSDQKDIVRGALDVAKQKSGTEFDSVALEYICLEYSNGQLGKTKAAAPSKPLADQLRDVGIEEALQELEKAYPNIDMTVNL